MPSGALPLKLVRRSERAIIERALSAPPPFTRLIAVVRTDKCWPLRAYPAVTPAKPSRSGCQCCADALSFDVTSRI